MRLYFRRSTLLPSGFGRGGGLRGLIFPNGGWLSNLARSWWWTWKKTNLLTRLLTLTSAQKAGELGVPKGRLQWKGNVWSLIDFRMPVRFIVERNKTPKTQCQNMKVDTSCAIIIYAYLNICRAVKFWGKVVIDRWECHHRIRVDGAPQSDSLVTWWRHQPAAVMTEANTGHWSVMSWQQR